MPLIALVFLVLTPVALAQSAYPRPEVGAWLGLSLHSPVGEHLGITPDREFMVLGLRYSRRLISLGPVSLHFQPEIIPAAVITNNPEYESEEVGSGDETFVLRTITGYGPVYGAGIAPVALELRVRMHRRFDLVGGGSIGGLVFTRNVPVPDARALNVTFDAGGGIRLALDERRRVIAGYRFHHLSNGWTARQNPGLDAQLFYAGCTLTLSR
jgi:hypothetical protein